MKESCKNKDPDLSVEVSSFIEATSSRVINGEIYPVDSAISMSSFVRSILEKTSLDISKIVNMPVRELPFGLFVFGSTSRNLMLPNSDLDVGTVFKYDCPKDIQDLVRSSLTSLPFDKIDIASWTTVDGMKKENCPNMIEYSKATDAKFIIGSQEIEDTYNNEVKGKDSKEDKCRRLISEYGLLHLFDYPSKKSTLGPNLKYDFGASRDIIFLDWYFLIMQEEQDCNSETPYFRKGLQVLLQNREITNEDFIDLERSIELILLVKFTCLNLSRKHNDNNLLYCNDINLSLVISFAPKSFKMLGIESLADLLREYNIARSLMHKTVKKIYSNILQRDIHLRQVWEISSLNNNLESIKRLLDPISWHTLIPFAIHSRSPEVLEYIFTLCSENEGYEYILRILSQNPHLNTSLVEKLLKAKLPARYHSKLTTQTP